MILVWTGLFLIVLKLLQVGPLADASWWWVLMPLIAAFVWFEVFENRLGFDRRKVDESEWQKGRKKRIATTLGMGKRGRPGAGPPKH